MKRHRVMCFVTFMLLATSAAFADAAAVDFLSPGIEVANSINYSLGFSFGVLAPTTVTALGTYDYLQDGLANDMQVGLWTSGGALLASTYVTSADTLDGFWRFRSISPLNLTMGETYIVASQGGEGFTYATNGFFTAPEIQFLFDRWEFGVGGNNPLVFPTLSDAHGADIGGAWFGGNLKVASVPEPASLLLLGTGIVMIGTAAWRRRK